MIPKDQRPFDNTGRETEIIDQLKALLKQMSEVRNFIEMNKGYVRRGDEMFFPIRDVEEILNWFEKGTDAFGRFGDE